MATIKSYTDIEQSKKLAEFLPLESADMYIYKNVFFGALSCFNGTTQIMEYIKLTDKESKAYPCWSLAALLDVLNKCAYFINEAGKAELSSIKAAKWCISILNCGKIEDCYADNPIDVCYKMILKLQRLKML